MKRYRLRDLPPKSWPSHIWMYYRWHLLGAFLAAVTLAGMLRPLWAGRVDLSILWLGESHDLATDAALEDRLARLPLDVDGDGKSRCLVHYLRFTGEEGRLTDGQIELVTLIGTGEFNVYLASGEAKAWLEARGILGSWSDFTGRGEDAAPFAVPCFDNYRNCGLSFRNPAQLAWIDEGLSLGLGENRHFSEEAYRWLLPRYEALLEGL